LVSLPTFLSRVNLALRRVPAGWAVAVIAGDVAEITRVRGSPRGPAAEEAAQAVARWVLATAGPADAAALVGGGEFAILCGGVRESGETDTIVRRIRDAMTRTFDVAGAPVSVATATGVAIASPEDTAERLIAAAARAMRVARQWDAPGRVMPARAYRAPVAVPLPRVPSGNGDSHRAAASPAPAASAAMELAESVTGQLFGVGVVLESAATLADAAVATRIRQALDELDAIIREARTAAFGGWPQPGPGAWAGSPGDRVKAATPG
jgi:GGDEF domain-containing protein